MTNLWHKTLITLILSPVTLAGVQGESFLFTSSNGIQEQCVAVTHVPGGEYSNKDLEQEQSYCQIDFYNGEYALCPKTWSTSPGTMVYDTSMSRFSAEEFEANYTCGRKNRPSGIKTKVKFKQTMNAHGTSGTFSTSSLLYYHFSRYFGTKVRVPVAVYREMDKDAHHERVSVKGLARSTGRMIKQGWRVLERAERSTSTYSPTNDLFTSSRKQIYGVLLRGKGSRYGTELNGTRVSGWGSGQNRDFQETPAYRALRSNSSLKSAIGNGNLEAQQDRRMRPDLVDISDLQMVYWMRELTEITLLDYIFSQQDRIGNIDYQWYWYWVQDGEVRKRREKRDEYKDLPRKRMRNIPVPADLVSFSPVLIQRTNLNDNDAGGRIAYTNFAKRTNMLNDIRHYSAKLYNRLIDLDLDLQSEGELYQWLSQSFGLTARRIRQVVQNTHLAANIMRAQCSQMQFDLDDVDNFLIEGPRLESVDCSR